MSRPDNREYFLNIAKVVATRSTCARRAVGCVLVNAHNHIIATAYNSVPKGERHCIDVPCPGVGFQSGEGLDQCIAQHAETLALIRCPDIYDIRTCYVTTAPCIGCMRRLVDTSCRTIVFRQPYAHRLAQEFWLGLGREWIHA